MGHTGQPTASVTDMKGLEAKESKTINTSELMWYTTELASEISNMLSRQGFSPSLAGVSTCTPHVLFSVLNPPQILQPTLVCILTELSCVVANC